MRFIPNFDFDQISFWLGFLAASLFWWVFSKFKFVFPALKSFIANQKESFQKRRTYGTELYLRRQTIQKAQKLHLAHELVALDDILVQPYLIAPPTSITPDNPIRTDTLINQTIPYYPDIPELSSSFSTTRLTPVEALQGGANILVVGQPGCGKTVALANLATKLSRKDSQIKDLEQKIPLFLHVMDLDLTQFEKEPESVLIQALSEQSTSLISKRLSRLIDHHLNQGSCLIILDGLDELPASDIQITAKFLKTLLNKFPGNQFIAAASPDYIDSLANINTFPLALAAWDNNDKAAFCKKWKTIWKRHYIQNDTKTISEDQSHPAVIINWFLHDPSFHTPLEWTLHIWSALAGDVIGPRLIDAMTAYLERISHNTVPAEALSAGAIQLIQSRQPGISYKLLSKTFSKLRPADFPEVEEESDSLAQIDLPSFEKTKRRRSSKQKKSKKISSADRAIITLLDAGLLIEHRNDQLRFASPLLTGCFAAILMEDIDFISAEKEKWSVELCALQFMASRNKATLWIQDSLRQTKPPFFHSLLSICRAIQNTPRKSSWRSEVMGNLLDMLYDKRLSLLERFRILASFTLTNDSSLTVLFRKLLNDQSPEIRFLGALGCGLIHDVESVSQLLQTLRDPIIDVQIAACLGLSAISSPNAFQGIVDALLQGEEDLQQIAAELLASFDSQGHEVLKEALDLDNLMVRRAAVLGLSQIREKWSAELLEKISIEDSQWVVRNAAGQAHNTLLAPKRQIPKPLTPPAETSWLISFASEKGLGIAPDEDAIEILLSALKTGSNAEKIAALDYLRLSPDQEIVEAVSSTMEIAEGDLQLASYFASWQLNIMKINTP